MVKMTCMPSHARGLIRKIHPKALRTRVQIAAAQPLISVVMPVRNGVQFLKSAVESILSQSFGDFEFVVVDDDSQDATLEILQSYAKADKRVKVLRNQSQPGIATALNLGIKVARGRYIARQDADDCSRSDRLELQLAFLDRNLQTTIVGSYMQMIDEAGSPLRVHREPLGPPTVLFHLQFGTSFAHPTVLMRADFLRRIPELYREMPAQDYDLWARMILAGARGDNIPEPLVKYRLHPASDSNLRSVDHVQAADQISRACLARLTGIPPEGAYCSWRFRALAHSLLTGNPGGPPADCLATVPDLHNLIRLCRKNRTLTWFEGLAVKKVIKRHASCAA
jgi:Glycosyl transferase family 2